MSTSGRWSSPDSIFHSFLLIPSEKLLGSNEGIDGIARMSPLVTSSTTTEPDWSPIRRAAYWWRSESIVSWTVPPLRSGLGSSSLTSLPFAVTSTRCPPGSPRSVGFQRLFQTFLADLHAWDEEQRVLVFLLIFRCRCRSDIADQLTDRRAARIEAREAARCGDARQLGQPNRDRRILLVRNIVGDRDRLKSARRRQLASDPLHFVRRQVHQLTAAARSMSVAISLESAAGSGRRGSSPC